MKCTNGNKNSAADLLGITLRSLRYRCSKLGVDKSFD
ncbi:MAG: helix-turn-helix domain-containing protein [Desulfobacterales bacterium]